MITFSDHNKSGNIEINEELWKAFHTQEGWKQELDRFNNLII